MIKKIIAVDFDGTLCFDAVNENLTDTIAIFGNNSRKISCDLYIDNESWRPDKQLGVI